MNNRPVVHAQYLRHSQHLMSRLLNIRTNASPFTLVLDDLNQRATPLLSELLRRGASRNVNVVCITFEPIQAGLYARLIHAHSLTGNEIMQDLDKAISDAKESLVIVDSLYELVNHKEVNMGFSTWSR
jgi:elongator complex protein 5